MTQQFLESAYSAAKQQMTSLIKGAWPDNPIREKELRMFACSLAMVAQMVRAQDASREDVTTELDKFSAQKLHDFSAEEIKTFQDRSYIYRTITFDVLGQNEIAVESLWTEATRHIVEMDDSQRARGFIQGTMGIPQVVQAALQGSSLDSEKPLKRGGCLVILLLTGVAAVSSTLLALFQTWT